jgi:hypothetical protein
MTRGATLETIRRTFVTIAMRVEARESYVAFGNPLLLGASGTDKRAWDKQRCAPSTSDARGGTQSIARRGVFLACH